MSEYSVYCKACLGSNPGPVPQEDNLSLFYSNPLPCACAQSNKLNNKYVYHKSPGTGVIQHRPRVDWIVSCSLLIGTDCQGWVFSLILASSVGLWTGIRCVENWFLICLFIPGHTSGCQGSDFEWKGDKHGNLSPFHSKSLPCFRCVRVCLSVCVCVCICV